MHCLPYKKRKMLSAMHEELNIYHWSAPSRYGDCLNKIISGGPTWNKIALVITVTASFLVRKLYSVLLGAEILISFSHRFSLSHFLSVLTCFVLIMYGSIQIAFLLIWPQEVFDKKFWFSWNWLRAHEDYCKVC